MKTALITGANKGIGFETARQLAQAGHFVYLGCRDKAKGREALDRLRSEGLVRTDWVQLDVTDPDSIRSARQELEAKTEKLDILVNNAGIRGSIPQPATGTSMDQLRLVFETNFFGTVNVTQQFIDLLKRSGQPVIVNVTSDLASLTNHSDPDWEYFRFKSAAYGPSKTALNAYTVVLAHELKEQNFKVNCVNPGYTATDLNDFQGEKPVEQGAAVIVKYASLEGDGATGKFFSEEGETPW